MDGTLGLELWVVATSTLALGMAVWSLAVSHTDHLVLRRSQQNGLKRLTITARLVRDIARCCCAGVMLVGAIWCLILPPCREPVALILKTSLSLVSIFLAVAVASDFRWRRLIDAALEQTEMS